MSCLLFLDFIHRKIGRTDNAIISQARTNACHHCDQELQEACIKLVASPQAEYSRLMHNDLLCLSNLRLQPWELSTICRARWIDCLLELQASWLIAWHQSLSNWDSTKSSGPHVPRYRSTDTDSTTLNRAAPRPGLLSQPYLLALCD